MNPITQKYLERKKEFEEKGANFEHNRWVRWQKYLHSRLIKFGIPNEDGNYDRIMKADDFLHWEKQIRVPYSELSEQEKESDRKETREYLPLQKSDILTVIEAVENQVRNKRKELWAHYHELQQWKEQKIAVSGIDDFLHFLKEAKEEINQDN